MKVKLPLIALGAAGLAIASSLLAGSILKSMQPCEQVMVLAVGGCDGEGLCASVVGTLQGEVRKTKVSYPVAGVVECIREE